MPERYADDINNGLSAADPLDDLSKRDSSFVPDNDIGNVLFKRLPRQKCDMHTAHNNGNVRPPVFDESSELICSA